MKGKNEDLMQKNESEQDKLIRFIKVLVSNWGQAKIPQNAAQSSYYALMSLFPLLLVLANVIPLFPININELLANLQEFLPENIFDIIAPILTNYLSLSSGGVLSIGLITAIWSASNLINSLRFVLNEVYNVEDTNEDPLLGRILSPFIMIFLMIVGGLLAFAFVFGEQILNFIRDLLQIELGFIDTFLTLRWPVLLLVLFVIFLFMYRLIPNHEMMLKDGLPGAVFASISFLLLSELFTLYTKFSGAGEVSNAAIGTVIVLMLYLYFSAILILIGGLLNSVIYEFKHEKSVRLTKLDRQSEEADISISQVYSIQSDPILLRNLRKLYVQDKRVQALEKGD